MNLFALIGHPVSHSFSAQYFNALFAKENIPAHYELVDLQSMDDLPGVLSRPGLRGFNVTVPHKRAVLPFLQNLSDEARAIGAVNTVCVEPSGLLTGHNTDVFGFAQSLKPFLTNHHEWALILGTGGASQAVAHVLSRLGVNWVKVSRKPSADGTLHYSQINASVLRSCKLIVNCTPVGMHPHIGSMPPLTLEGLTPDHLVYDLIYNPEETELLRDARLRGATTLNGLSMLHLQAEKAWQLWQPLIR